MDEMTERVALAIVKQLKTQAEESGDYISDGAEENPVSVRLDGSFDLLAAGRAAIEVTRETTRAMHLCDGGIDPGFDECPKCGATSDEECRYAPPAS